MIEQGEQSELVQGGVVLRVAGAGHGSGDARIVVSNSALLNWYRAPSDQQSPSNWFTVTMRFFSCIIQLLARAAGGIKPA